MSNSPFIAPRVPSWWPAVIPLLMALMAACAGSSATVAPGSANGAASSQRGPSHPSRVSIGIWAESPVLQPKLLAGGSATQAYNFDFSLMVNSPLSIKDAQGATQPRLASELPSQDRGTWTVSSDGTMATTWKIRPGALWHDGQRVTSSDFAFALKVYKDEGIVVSNREVEQFIDRIEGRDDGTFVIYWKQTYPWANQLGPMQLEPLPEHILGRVYEAGDKEAFQNASFWSTTSYIGNGPYRIVDWVKGSQVTYRAFDQYYLGRPKIDEVIFQLTPASDTVVAWLLSGFIDVTVNTTMNQAAWASAKEQWDRTGDGRIALIPVHLRATQPQLEPARVKQPALLDVRVRRALVHALERPVIAEVVLQGASSAADLQMVPNDPLFPQAQQAIARYPYDPTRALALLQEAGWIKRGDTLVNPAGQRFTLDIWTTEMADNLTEMRIMADYLAKIGIETTQTGIPEARNRDNEYRASFPGLTITGQIIDLPRSLRVYTAEQCPVAERRFLGSNRGCWISPDFDRLHRTAMTTLDDREREGAILEAFKILTEDVGVIPMSYNLDNIAVRKGLVGPGQRWPAPGGDTWNIHEWRWE